MAGTEVCSDLPLLSSSNRVPVPDLIKTIHLLNARVPEIGESSSVDLCNLVSDIILSYALGQAPKCPWASVSITVRKDWNEYISFCLRSSNNLWFLIQLWIFQHSDYSIFSVTTIHSLITELLIELLIFRISFPSWGSSVIQLHQLCYQLLLGTHAQSREMGEFSQCVILLIF